MKGALRWVTVAVILTLLSAQLLAGLGRDAPFPLSIYAAEQEDPIDHEGCVDHRTLVATALKQGLDSQEHAERLYQARYRISASLGGLGPHINLTTFTNAAQGSFWSVIPNLVGFLYPSKWFDWKESQNLYEAQRYSYKTLLGNVVNILDTVILNIQRNKVAHMITKFYRKNSDRVLERVFWQMEHHQRPVDDETLGNLKGIRARLAYQEEEYERNLQEAHIELANVINYRSPWYELCFIEKERKPSLPRQLAATKTEQLTVFFRSSELGSLEFLLKSAILHQKSSLFSFFTPEGENPLGLGYYSNIKINKSQIKLIKVEIEKAKSGLKVALEQAKNQINRSRSYSKYARSILRSIDGQRNALIENLEDMDERLDLEKSLRFFEYALDAELKKNDAKYLGLLAEAQLARLFWHGEHYEQIPQYVPTSKLARTYESVF